MCQDCLFEPRPDRGTTCLDDGAYLVNFKGCFICGKRIPPRNINKTEEEDDDEEEQVVETSFHHICECGHLIASHFHRETSAQSVTYLMECFLCGKGVHEKERYRWGDIIH